MKDKKEVLVIDLTNLKKTGVKATLIISQEYYANQPSVFAMINGNYYGCPIYTTFRGFPESPEYWKTATSSDSDRGFKVSEVEYSDSEFQRIQILQNVIFSCSKMIVVPPSTWVPKNWKIRKGKVYQEHTKRTVELSAANKKVSDVNAPFEKVIYIASNELRKLLLKTKLKLDNGN